MVFLNSLIGLPISRSTLCPDCLFIHNARLECALRYDGVISGGMKAGYSSEGLLEENRSSQLNCCCAQGGWKCVEREFRGRQSAWNKASSDEKTSPISEEGNCDNEEVKACDQQGNPRLKEQGLQRMPRSLRFSVYVDVIGLSIQLDLFLFDCFNLFLSICVR